MNNFYKSDLTKLYYSIGEVADMFNVNTSLIRFWEKEFDFQASKKNKKGNRLYNVKDIEQFNKIYELVKIEGFTLEGAKNQLKIKKVNSKVEMSSKELSKTEIIEKLELIKLKLLNLKD